MTWSEGDIWTAEASLTHCSASVIATGSHARLLPFDAGTNILPARNYLSIDSQVELPANTRVEYKYVIMEEQVTLSAP
jgi:hypothetical protein